MSERAFPWRRPRTGLWRHADFLKLWMGQTISMFGARVTMLALPLTAIFTLHATTIQMGLLMVAGTAPYLLVGLPAGAWVDRLRRRPVMIAADLGRAGLLASIPLTAILGLLQIGQLYALGFLVSALTVFFDAAYQSFLPSLVSRELLVEGNSKLTVSASLAQIAGPGLGGGLVQVLTAPIAITADALSFVISAISLGLIRTPEPAPAQPEHPRLSHEIGEGMRVVLADSVLRALTGSASAFNLFDSVLFAVYVLFMTRQLGLAAPAVGLVFGLGGIGGLLGALVVGPLTRRLGLGPTIIGGLMLAAAAELLIAAAGGPVLLAILVLVVAEMAVELGATLFSVNAVSLRQGITPRRLQGRVAATVGFLTTGVGPMGALVGGVLGAAIGLRGTVLVSGLGTFLAVIVLVSSRVQSVRQEPVAGSPQTA